MINESPYHGLKRNKETPYQIELWINIHDIRRSSNQITKAVNKMLETSQLFKSVCENMRYQCSGTNITKDSLIYGLESYLQYLILKDYKITIKMKNNDIVYKLTKDIRVYESEDIKTLIKNISMVESILIE